MRHLGSLLAGLVIAPLAWVLIAAGQPRTAQTFERWRTLDSVYTGDLLKPLGLLVAAGVLIGVVLALRLSPLGPLVAGVGYLAVYGFSLRDPYRVLDLLPQLNLWGYKIDTTVPFTNGTMAVIGAALVVAAVSRRRWQRWPTPAAAVPVSPAPESPAPIPVSPAPAAPEEALTMTVPAQQHEAPPAVGPLPPAAPLWPSTNGAPPASPMEPAMSPGTAEDLPRRTPPKRPASPAHPDPDGWPEPRPIGWPGPVIPGPRHAGADDHPDSGPSFGGPIQPTFRFPPPGPAMPSGDDVPPPRPAGDDRPSPYATDEGDWTHPSGDDSGPSDSGAQAGPPQAGPPQAGPPQAGPPQAGPPQAGPPQARPPQAVPSAEPTQVLQAPQPPSGSGPAPAAAAHPPRPAEAEPTQVLQPAQPPSGSGAAAAPARPTQAPAGPPRAEPPAEPTQVLQPPRPAQAARPPQAQPGPPAAAPAQPGPPAAPAQPVPPHTQTGNTSDDSGPDPTHQSPWARPPRPNQD